MGLLQKDPSQRLTWPALLEHPFVENRIVIVGGAVPTPFTTPLSASQARAKQLQFQNLAMRPTNQSKVLEKTIGKLQDQERKLEEKRQRICTSHPRYPVSHAYCQRGINHCQALRHSEPSGTDSSTSVDVLLGNLSLRASLRSDLLAADYAICQSGCPNTNANANANANANGNVNANATNRETRKKCLGISLEIAKIDPTNIGTTENIGENKEKLENGNEGMKYKPVEISTTFVDLSRARQETALANQTNPDYAIEMTRFRKNGLENNENNVPRSRLPDWNPRAVERPIENEEWIAFLQWCMEELMEGEIGSLIQQNCVSVFVSPLRNPAAGCRVVEYVACLLSLPFVVSVSKDSLEKIEQVYLDVRVVPNLVYAMKLLMSERSDGETNDKTDSQTMSVNTKTRSASTLSADELQTLECTMLLLCRLTYNREQFLTQFCDAIYIVNGITLLQQLLTLEKRKARVVADLVAILTNVLRSQPENAELVERVVLHTHMQTQTLGAAVEQVSKLLTHKQGVLRSRTCYLIRLLGRFSCRALQQVWGTFLRYLVESLILDDDPIVRNAAEEAVNELKQLTYYDQRNPAA